MIALAYGYGVMDRTGPSVRLGIFENWGHLFLDTGTGTNYILLINNKDVRQNFIENFFEKNQIDVILYRLQLWELHLISRVFIFVSHIFSFYIIVSSRVG